MNWKQKYEALLELVQTCEVHRVVSGAELVRFIGSREGIIAQMNSGLVSRLAAELLRNGSVGLSEVSWGDTGDVRLSAHAIAVADPKALFELISGNGDEIHYRAEEVDQATWDKLRIGDTWGGGRVVDAIDDPAREAGLVITCHGEEENDG